MWRKEERSNLVSHKCLPMVSTGVLYQREWILFLRCTLYACHLILDNAICRLYQKGILMVPLILLLCILSHV